MGIPEDLTQANARTAEIRAIFIENVPKNLLR